MFCPIILIETSPKEEIRELSIRWWKLEIAPREPKIVNAPRTSPVSTAGLTGSGFGKCLGGVLNRFGVRPR